MVVETLLWLREMHGIEIITVAVQFPINDKAQIVDDVSKAFEAHNDIKLAVFSHISSMVSLEGSIALLVFCHKMCDVTCSSHL
jgi:chaperone required for assembly of F1-ATPase